MKKSILSFFAIILFLTGCSVAKNDSADKNVNDKDGLNISVKPADNTDDSVDIVEAIITLIDPDGNVETRVWKSENDNEKILNFYKTKNGKYKIIISGIDSNKKKVEYGEDLDLKIGNDYSITIKLGGNIKIVINDKSDNNLIAEYLFGGNAFDTSGNGLNGAVIGATLTEDRHGNPNSAYYFDGYGDYIKVQDNDKLEVTNVRTITLWFNKYNTLQKNNNYGVLTKYKCDTPTESGWVVMTPEKDIRSYYKGTSSVYYYNFDYNQWYFAAVTINDVTKEYSLYVNGEMVSSVLYDNYCIYDNPNNMLIGACYIADGSISTLSYFYGAIDDIRIYSKCLSSGEIGELFAQNSN
jgi:hypothetical protein